MHPPGTAPKKYVKLLVVCLVGIILILWLWVTPDGLLGKADAIGYSVCHRIDLRSFHLGDRQIPLCARCTGQYLGAVTSLVFLFLTARTRCGPPPKRYWILFGSLFLLWVFDGVNSALSLVPNLPQLYPPSNELRLASGLGAGLGIGLVIYIIFNQVIWKEYHPEPVFSSVRSLLSLLCITAMVGFMVYSENPLLLYPLSLVSVGGTLLLLSAIYSLMIALLFHRENFYTNFAQAKFLFLGGFGVGLLQVLLMDLFRHWITGTWGGFSL